MGGVTLTLEVAKSTLVNSQTMIEIASHNISNADKKTYARQRGVQITNPPYLARAGWLGTGARVHKVIQYRDQFIERRLMESISKESDYQTRSTQLNSLQAYVLDDGEAGISQMLGEFWDAWDALNQNPGGLAEKALVEDAAQNLAIALQQVHADVTRFASDIEGQTGDQVTAVNSLLTRIAGYNEQIVKSELGGHPANDLRDKRYEALTELATYIPFEFTEESDGALTITQTDYLTDITLVSGKQYGSLAYDDSEHQVTYTDTSGASHPAAGDTSELSGGSLEGLLSVYRYISGDDGYLARLETFVDTVISEVNNIHISSPVFRQGVDNIIEVDPGFSVDGTVALDMAGLQETKIGGLEDSTFGAYLGNLQQQIGLEHQQAASRSDFYGTLRQQLEADQQSVSGISIDEEMVDLLKYQHIYEAAAKLIQTCSEMLDTVIRMV